MNPKVSIIRCASYDEAAVASALIELLAPLGGIGAYVKPGDRVLLKPNLLTAKPPEAAVTTHPALVTAVCRLVRNAGGIPSVGDCSGVILVGAETIWENTGIKAAAEAAGAGMVSLESGGYTIKAGIPVSSAALGYDLIINLPKFKTHCLTGISGAVKNLFGLVPGMYKTRLHAENPGRREFAEMLLKIYGTFVPALNIMDGITGMEGDGPSAGNPCYVGMLLASDEAIALDTVMSSLMGIVPGRVVLLELAAEQGLPGANLCEIELFAPALEGLVLKDFKLPV